MLWPLFLGALVFVLLGIAVARYPARTAEFIRSSQQRSFGSSMGGSHASLRVVGVLFVLIGAFLAVMAVLGLLGVVDFEAI